MAVVNYKKNEIQLKIVYYGPGRGGKTTCLEFIKDHLAGQAHTDMIKLKGPESRTLFFDFYPMRISNVRGFDIRVQLYSVPGQSRLQPLRKVVLKGVDSVVFVADAMTLRRRQNVESFKNLIENLGHYNKNLFAMPFIMQLNKVDLAEENVPTISVQTLKSDLTDGLGAARLIEKVPVYETNALSGDRIIEALEAIIRLTVRRLNFAAIAKAG